MKALILAGVLAGCLLSPQSVSAYYGNNYYGSGNNLGYSYSNLGSVGGCNYGGVTSSPYMAGYGSGTATTTYMPAAGMSETQFSGGGSATTTYMPYAGMSSTTYRAGY